MKKKNKIIALCVICVIFIITVVWIAWGNKALELNTYRITSYELPKVFDGFRIAQISDLHNAEIGKGNEKLISMLKEAEPNIIVITGDMIDYRNTNIDVALNFSEQAVKIATCYYVSGNHEARISAYEDFKESLVQIGVTVLEDDKAAIEFEGESITLVGVSDPSFSSDHLLGDDESVMKAKLSELISDESGYIVLLSHRPELFDIYFANGVNLIFSGHAHGGQFRLPFAGGVVAPDQGLFPKYDAGIYSEGDTNMAVSRGVGNSIFPFRVNNRPEIVLVELYSDSISTESVE